MYKRQIYNRKTRIELEIDKFDLSNHAGRSELVDFARACNPRYLILFHTPDEDVDGFAELFGPDPPFEVLIPTNGRDLIIDMDA